MILARGSLHCEKGLEARWSEKITAWYLDPLRLCIRRGIAVEDMPIAAMPQSRFVARGAVPIILLPWQAQQNQDKSRLRTCSGDDIVVGLRLQVVCDVAFDPFPINR